MECPMCQHRTKVSETRTLDKPGKGNETRLSTAAIASKTRFFVLRVRSCDECGWSDTTVEITMEHLEWLRSQEVEPTTLTVTVSAKHGLLHARVVEVLDDDGD